MITWTEFIWFGIASILFWIVGALLAIKKQTLGTIVYGIGVGIFMLYLILYTIGVERVPMRTMGETRLWYSFFLSSITLLLYLRWHYNFMLIFGAILSTVFTIINIAKPEIHTTTLMPALQSGWFIPHVTIYMIAYALVAIAQILAFIALCRKPHYLLVADNLIRIGSALILLGMLMGAVWAKQAWGNYWAWDAKENWAAVTWILYISYIHMRRYFPTKEKLAITLLTIAFIALQITWYGVNYMPAALKSLHTYTMN